MSRVRAISRRAKRLAALNLPPTHTQSSSTSSSGGGGGGGGKDGLLTIHEALYWATDCSDFSTHTRVTLKLSPEAPILEKEGNLLLRLVRAWQRLYDEELEGDEEEEEEEDEDEEEEEGGHRGKWAKRPLVCPFLRPLGLFPLGDPGLVGGLRSGMLYFFYTLTPF